MARKTKKLVLFIDFFTIIFFLVIALYFLVNIGSDKNFTLAQLRLAQFPFILGLLLNSLNFIQWPYWSGIYIYLFRSKKLDPRCKDNSVFIIGAMAGTSIGMLLFAHAGKQILIENKIEISQYLNIIFSLLFLFLAGVQIVKLLIKKNKTTHTNNLKFLK
jgi:hypothetical protein